MRAGGRHRHRWSPMPTHGAPSLGSIETLEMSVDRVSQMAHVRSAMRTWLHRALPGQADVDDVLLACGEALSNALEHGTPPARIALSLDDTDPPVVRVSVHDAGPWLDRAGVSGRGFGLGIMRRVMTDVDVDTHDGTTLIMRKQLAGAAGLESPGTG